MYLVLTIYPLLDCRYCICWSSWYQSICWSSNTPSSLWNFKILSAGTCEKGNVIKFSGADTSLSPCPRNNFLNLHCCLSKFWCRHVAKYVSSTNKYWELCRILITLWFQILPVQKKSWICLRCRRLRQNFTCVNNCLKLQKHVR